MLTGQKVRVTFRRDEALACVIALPESQSNISSRRGVGLTIELEGVILNSDKRGIAEALFFVPSFQLNGCFAYHERHWREGFLKAGDVRRVNHASRI